MKILILCDMFPPAFAPRMGYLCKYMKEAGWEPVVITERIHENMFAFLTGYAEVIYINYYRATGKITKKSEWLSVFLLDFFFHYKDRKMADKAAALIKKNNSYGGILCSTFRTFPLRAALKTAKRFHLPLIADTRDIIEQHPAHEYISFPFHTFSWLDPLIVKIFRRKLLKERNKVLREADCITTVSPWHVEMMKQYNPNVKLIYNGYDPDLFYPEQIVTRQFRLTYTGRLVSLATRDPRPLFEAVAMLDKKIISKDIFRIQWYIDEKSKKMIVPLAEEYGISDYMDYYDFVSADTLPGILNRSSILLQLANKAGESGPKGIMSTKLFESFAVEKPMLCVRSDESFLEENIRLANAGASARTAQEAYDFILHHFNEWKEKGFTTVRVNREITESYSRRKQAVQFMHIFEELATTHI